MISYLHSARKSRSGFTLIELLVVIAIIAILAAILFPVFAKVREKARQTTCASNEKQMGLGITQYVQDYDEIFPPISVPSHYVDTGATPLVPAPYPYGNIPGLHPELAHPQWMDLINPYVKSAQIYFCPSDTANSDDSFEPGVASYGINRYLAIGNNDSSCNGPFESGASCLDIMAGLNKISAPTDMVLVTELGQAVNAAGQIDVAHHCEFAYYAQPSSGTVNVPAFAFTSGTDTERPIHPDGVNFLFVDGHVKFIVQGQQSVYNDPSTLTPHWQPG